MVTPEFAVLSAWYGCRPEVRRLWAVRDTQGLSVFVHMERAPDSSETHPAWMANREAWIEELHLRTGGPVRLEQTSELASDIHGAVIAEFAWRDPAFSQYFTKV